MRKLTNLFEFNIYSHTTFYEKVPQKRVISTNTYYFQNIEKNIFERFI